jgi:hypothetical protein
MDGVPQHGLGGFLFNLTIVEADFLSLALIQSSFQGLGVNYDEISLSFKEPPWPAPHPNLTPKT